MKIYTKTGDKGETGIVGGRIKKDSIIINTIGSFDELNSALGIIAAQKISENLNSEIIRSQNLIFCIGSILSGANIKTDFKKYTKNLENSIDKLNLELEELTQFILPGGSLTSSYIHLARTICRRAERDLTLYIDNYKNEKPEHVVVESEKLTEIQKYINRLSDYLFVFARYINKIEGVQDIYWNKLID